MPDSMPRKQIVSVFQLLVDIFNNSRNAGLMWRCGFCLARADDATFQLHSNLIAICLNDMRCDVSKKQEISKNIEIPLEKIFCVV